MGDFILWYHRDLPLDDRIKGWSEVYETGKMTGGAVLGLCADVIAQRNDYRTALTRILRWARDSYFWENGAGAGFSNAKLLDILADAGFEISDDG